MSENWQNTDPNSLYSPFYEYAVLTCRVADLGSLGAHLDFSSGGPRSRAQARDTTLSTDTTCIFSDVYLYTILLAAGALAIGV